MEYLKKARLNIDCSHEERRLIRILAAKEDKSISQYILDLVRREPDFCDFELNPKYSNTVIQQNS